jgi:hypothetical protein
VVTKEATEFALARTDMRFHRRGMTDPAPPPSPRQAEPALIERARRIGWMLIGIALAAMIAGRVGTQEWRTSASVVAVAAGLLGMLAVVNVALVRSLYRAVDAAPRDDDARDDQSM